MFRDWQISFRVSPPPKPNQSGPPPPPPPPPGLIPPPPRPTRVEYVDPYPAPPPPPSYKPPPPRPTRVEYVDPYPPPPPPPPSYKPPPPKYEASPQPFKFGPPRPDPFSYERPPPYYKFPAISFTWIPPPNCMGTFEWVPCHRGQVPPGAAEAGVDADRGPIYVGRAFHHGDLLPAKICPWHRTAFVSYGGREVEEHNAEVLISNHVSWRPAVGGNVPLEAIRVGQTADGEGLFMGRTMYQGTLTPGKVQPSHGCLYIPWNGAELRFTEYEVMVLV